MSLAASPALHGYTVPRYRAEGAAFYHFLHGTVPGHQIDFMYCPEVPQGALRQTHVGHLARLIKYIEPRDGAPYAFAIGNLSRDDVQHGPGHGGLSVVFALRVPGVVDHAGRDMPPYAHGVVAVDRQLTYGTLLQTTTALYRRFVERDGAEGCGDFYRSYVRTMREAPGDVEDFLATAIADFDDLPSPPRSTLGWDYAVDDGEPPRQITLVYDEPMAFGTIAHWAAALAALLYRSNIKWTSISAGRELAVAGGTTIRFVPRSDMRSGDGRSGIIAPAFELEALPEQEEALAMLLFGAKRRGAAGPAPEQGWRDVLAAQRAAEWEAGSADVDVDVDADDVGVAADRANDLAANDAAATDADDAAATIPVALPLDASRSFHATRSPSAGGPHAPGHGMQTAEEGPDAAFVRSTSPAAAVPPARRPVAATPQLGRGYRLSTPSEAATAHPGEAPRRSASRGHWIIVAVALAGLAVVIVVAVTAGMNIGMGPAVEAGDTTASSSSRLGNPVPPGSGAAPGASAAAAASAKADAGTGGPPGEGNTGKGRVPRPGAKKKPQPSWMTPAPPRSAGF